MLLTRYQILSLSRPFLWPHIERRHNTQQKEAGFTPALLTLLALESIKVIPLHIAYLCFSKHSWQGQQYGPHVLGKLLHWGRGCELPITWVGQGRTESPGLHGSLLASHLGFRASQFMEQLQPGFFFPLSLHPANSWPCSENLQAAGLWASRSSWCGPQGPTSTVVAGYSSIFQLMILPLFFRENLLESLT